MDVKYCFAFLVLAGLATLGAVVGWDVLGLPSLAFGYVAVSFAFLAAAYGGVGPGLLLKRKNGRRSVWAWVLFAPYFLLNALTFGLYRLATREPAFAEVMPGLFFGRRLSRGEARKARGLGWMGVLDLAAEFAETPPLRELPGYCSLAVLDATAPTDEQLNRAIEWLREAVSLGPVYVHCALGHGRTACVVVAYLLAIGCVSTVAEGVRLLRSFQPGVRLHGAQRKLLRRYEPTAKPSER